ncbi:MAG TPA: ParA family protein [Caldisericia bacterium]|nr:ParA family protein [Saprospiraceae bacterium]HQL69037.1 ParA family protein [Caldisericia bacterium]HUN19445.1 ParA family protein [Caldisericia bacterium]
MGKVISFVNNKGGVGKTTVAFNVGAGLADEGNKLLYIDLDPQASLTVWALPTSAIPTYNVADVFQDFFSDESGETNNLNKSIVYMSDNRSIATSSSKLETIQNNFAIRHTTPIAVKEIIKDVRNNFDYIILDCPPSMTPLLTHGAIIASDYTVIVTRPAYLDMKGIVSLYQAIRYDEKFYPGASKLLGVLLNQFDSRKNEAKEAETQLRSFFKEKVFNTLIGQYAVLSEAPSHHLSVFDYDKKSKASKQFKSLVEEVLERVKE